MERSIRQQVKALANKKLDELDEKSFFISSKLSKYLETLSGTLCGRNARPHRIRVISDGEDGVTAFTDGDNVTLNWQSNLVRFFSTTVERFVAFMGFFYHEHAHILYNDFAAMEKAFSSIENGYFYGDTPTPKNEEEEEWLDHLEAALATPEFSEIFLEIYGSLNNSVIDVHDEEKMIEDFGRMAKEPILKIREALRASGCTLEEVEQNVRDGKITKLTAMDNLMLEYVRFGRILSDDEEEAAKTEFGKTLRRIAAHSEQACRTDDPEERFSELNSIVLAFWPYVEEELKNLQKQDQQSQSQQNQQGGSQSQPQQGNSGGAGNQSFGSPMPSPTPEQLQKILGQLVQGAQKAPGTQPQQGQQNSQLVGKKPDPNDPNAGGKPQGNTEVVLPAGDDSGAESMAQKAYEQLTKEFAAEEAMSELEKEAAKKMQEEARNALSVTSTHKGVRINVDRVLEPSQAAVNAYKDVMSEIGLYSKRLQRQMLDIMRDLQMGGMNRHKAFGKTICAEDLYRPDNLFFANKKAPVDLPDMAVSILVDHSGSMSGERILHSMKAAILLHDFATGIGIPVAVAGHCTGNGVRYIVYSDFDAYTDKDKYRLGEMSASGCNRDGAAIEIAAARLQKRPEKIKMLIVISDGRPNDTGYYGKAAEDDISSIVAKYRRKNVEIIGAAIGDDRDTIARIYGEGFLDITDLSRLPKTLTALVKKRLMSQM